MRPRTVSIIKNHDKKRAKQWQVCYRDASNKRRAAFFDTRAEAEVNAEIKRTELQNLGLQALSMPDALRQEAFQASELLKPSGKGLLDAARWYLEHLRRNAPTCTVSELVEKFLAVKESDPISARHLGDLRARTRAFAAAMAPKMANEIEPVDITNWIRSRGLGPQSQRNFRQVLHNLFAFAKRNKFVQDNPVAQTPKIRVPDKEVDIYAPEEMAGILAVADPAIVPYLVLGAFAGLRCAEAMRLQWNSVDFGNGVIRVGGDIAKTRSKRLVPISDNLRAWLMPIAQKEGKVLPNKYQNTFRGLMHKACDKAKVRFRRNGFRHSYASYRIAQTGDVSKTAHEMGNSPDMIFRHYRQLVTPEQAAVYWSIRPDTEPNIIPIASAAA